MSLQSDNKKQKEIWSTIWPVLNKRYKRTATFLDHKNIWQLLIAVIMSAQTTDEGVNKVTPILFKKYPKPQDLAKAPVLDIAKIIHRVGYYNAKAKNIKETARIIVEKFNGKVPDNEVDLRSLPGVGRKTAVVVLSNGFGHDVGIAVDTHVIRFVHRFGLSHSHNPDIIERELKEIIPKKYWKRAGYAIKEYGRKEGKARGYIKENDPIWQAYQDVSK